MFRLGQWKLFSEGKNPQYANLIPILPIRCVGHRPLERLQCILAQIRSILHTTAHAYQVVKHPYGLALVLGDTSVGHGRRHLDERLDAAQRLSEREDIRQLTEALGSGVAAFDAERQHTASHAVAVLFFSDGAVGVGVEAWIVDGNDAGVGLEGLGYSGGVARGLAGAQVQGLEAAMCEPGVKGRGNGTDGVL